MTGRSHGRLPTPAARPAPGAIGNQSTIAADPACGPHPSSEAPRVCYPE